MAMRKKKKPSAKVNNSKLSATQTEEILRKCKFLIQRSEFLYQQGLSFNVQAQEIAADAAGLRSQLSALTAHSELKRKRRSKK